MYTWRDWLEGRYDIFQHIITTTTSTSTPYNNTVNYASIPLQSEHNPEWYGRFADVNGLETAIEQVYAASPTPEIPVKFVYESIPLQEVSDDASDERIYTTYAIGEIRDYYISDNNLYCKIRTPSPARPIEFINDAADDCNPDMRLLEEYINELAGT